MILLREGGTSSSRENVGAELSVGRACGRGCPFSLVSCSFLRLQLAGAFVLYYGVLSGEYCWLQQAPSGRWHEQVQSKLCKASDLEEERVVMAHQDGMACPARD